MLVLARRVNDSIVIGDNVEIVVVEIKGDQVKLGVKAPKEVKVFRGEIHADAKIHLLRASVACESLVETEDRIPRQQFDVGEQGSCHDDAVQESFFSF